MITYSGLWARELWTEPGPNSWSRIIKRVQDFAMFKIRNLRVAGDPFSCYRTPSRTWKIRHIAREPLAHVAKKNIYTAGAVKWKVLLALYRTFVAVGMGAATARDREELRLRAGGLRPFGFESGDNVYLMLWTARIPDSVEPSRLRSIEERRSLIRPKPSAYLSLQRLCEQTPVVDPTEIPLVAEGIVFFFFLFF